jgi:biotin carboxylase
MSLMMKNKGLIAVTAGVWQLQTIRQAKALAVTIIAIDSSAKAEGLAIADLPIIANLDDFTFIIAEITAKAPNVEIVGVLSICSDVGMLLAGKLRDHYRVTTGPNLIVSQRLVNKSLQRECWQRTGVNGPKWYSGKNMEELLSIAQKMSLPYMIKPVDSAGSRGVIKVETRDVNISKYLTQALSYSPSKQVIIEAFMQGPEYTVEAFVHQGKAQILAITEKEKINATQGLVAYRLSTTMLAARLQAKIEKLVIQAIAALDYKNGPCHAEVILMPDDSVGMVELAGRGGGFLVFERFVQLASGIDIVNNTIKQSLALPFSVDATKPNHCILHFFPNKVGKLVAITGFKEANKIENIEANTFVDIGVELKEASCDGDRMGYIISQHRSRRQAEYQLSQAITYINFEVKA